MPNMLKDIKQIEFPFFARFDNYQEAVEFIILKKEEIVLLKIKMSYT